MADSLAAVVLAAGYGTRLLPLTRLRPKALCPVGDVALVDLAIARVTSVTPDVAVNVHEGRAAVEAHLGGRVHLSVEETEPLGTAGALGLLRDWIAGRPTVVANADAWHGADLAVLTDGWDGSRSRLLVVAAGDRRADFGPWRYAGAALMPWDEVRRLQPEPSGLYEVSWRRLQQEDHLDLVPWAGPFFDCGTPRDYLLANLASSGGRSVIGAGAVVDGIVERSVVWAGAHVGAGERLVEAIRADGGLTVQT